MHSTGAGMPVDGSSGCTDRDVLSRYRYGSASLVAICCSRQWESMHHTILTGNGKGAAAYDSARIGYIGRRSDYEQRLTDGHGCTELVTRCGFGVRDASVRFRPWIIPYYFTPVCITG